MSEQLPFTVRPMTDDEMGELGWEDEWHTRPSVIEVHRDGYKEAVFVPAQDPELNGPGHLVEMNDDAIFGIEPATE